MLWVVFVVVLMGFCVHEPMDVVFVDVQTSPLQVFLTVLSHRLLPALQCLYKVMNVCIFCCSVHSCVWMSTGKGSSRK